MTRFIMLPILLLALFVCGCPSSLVYSPSVMLPSRPLVKEQGQLTGSLEMLPEARPHEVERFIVLGSAGTLRYAFSDRLTLGGRVFDDLTDDGFRGGLSGEAIVMVSTDSTSLIWGLMPRGAMLIDDGSIDGGGFTIAPVVWFPVTSTFSLYGSLGPVVGFRDLSSAPAEWGYGLIGNMGAGVRLHPELQVTAELAAVAQVNIHDDVQSGAIAPGISISWIF